MKKTFILALMMFLSLGISNLWCADVTFESKDGLMIKGTLNADSSNNQTAILIHMLNHDRSDWESFSKFLNENGWNTLAIDLRGHGESKGVDNKIDWKNFKKDDFQKLFLDIEAAFQYLKNQKMINDQAIFLIGASIGANASLQYASQNPEVAGVILLSPGVDYRGIKTKPSVMKYKDRPILIIASSDDTYSMSSSDFLYQLAPTSKKEFLKLNSKGHGTDMLNGNNKLENNILQFMTQSVSAKKQ